MKRWMKQLGCALLALSLLTPTPQVSAQPRTRESQENLSSADETTYEEIDDLIQNIQELEHFQMRIKMTDEDQGIPIAEGKLLVDNEQGDMLVDMLFYEAKDLDSEEANSISDSSGRNQADGEPPLGTQITQHPFKLLAYSGFDLAYINQTEILNSAVDALLNGPTQQKMTTFNHYYTPIDSSELDRLDFDKYLVDAVQFLPNREALKEVDLEHIKETDKAYTLHMDRAEIPQNLFEQETGFLLNMELNMETNKVDTAYKEWDVNVDQRFSVEDDRDDFSINNSLNMDFDDLIEDRNLGSSETDAHRSQDENDLDDTEANDSSQEESSREKESPLEGIQRKNYIRFNNVTGKMTHATLQFDKENSQYIAVIEGIGEEINFDFFNDSSTQPILTRNYRLEISIEPTEQRVPDFQSLPKLSNQEYSLILEELLAEP